MKLQQIAAIIAKDLRLFFSNRAAVVLTVAVPVIIASFFGNLTSPKKSSGSGRLKLWVVDQDRSAISAEIVTKLKEDQSVKVSEHTEDETRAAVAAGDVSVAVVLPQGFGESAGSSFFTPGGKPVITLLTDPSRSIEAEMARGVLFQHGMAVISRQAFSPGGAKWIDQSFQSVEQMADAPQRTALRDLLTSVRRWQQQSAPSAGDKTSNSPAAGLSMPFETKVEPLTASKGAVYNGYAHSFGGMGLQFILLFAIECAVALLQDRKSGMWRRMRAAPVPRSVVLAGRALSCALISLGTMAVCWLFAILVFGVRVHGSWAGFVLVNVASSLLAASLALMLAAIGRSVEATRGIAIFAVLILVMLGGAWMPSFVFPEWMQEVTQFIPTRWAVDGLDATTWRGLPFSAVATPLLAMLGCTALFSFVAWWRFRWQGE